MVLSSSVYFVFLVGIFLLYWPLSRWRAAGLAVLLFANYFFYAKWDLFYLLLIPGASFIDYLIGLGLGAGLQRPAAGPSAAPTGALAPLSPAWFQQLATRAWFRRLLLSCSLVLNLGILACFKYMPFFLSTWSGATGHKAPAWHWTFPLGISFYCFQALSYTIDLYRRDGKPVRSLLTYLTAVSFFPTTLAGPITRPLALAPQLEKPGKRLALEDSGRALFRIALGLLKKFLIADYLAENLVNRVFDTPGLYTGMETFIAVWAFAFQIYYDFSGYTDLAIGSAMLLGIKLPENFNRPYIALNISEFWRRWHITLSNWLRDYVYFSLPGLRSKWKIFTYINLIVTMVLGGLWHGPSWNFVAWGALHGVALAAHHGFRAARGNPKPSADFWIRFLSRLLTANYVAFCWIFFRATSFENAGAVLGRIASLTVSFANISPALLTVLGVAALGQFSPRGWYDFSMRQFVRVPFYAQAAAVALLVLAIQYVAMTGAAPFIYTKF
jgi:D-alanyl-lipoteichoic acid acyltransferase DltB (MBOAT superfamily)